MENGDDYLNPVEERRFSGLANVRLGDLVEVTWNSYGRRVAGYVLKVDDSRIKLSFEDPNSEVKGRGALWIGRRESSILARASFFAGDRSYSLRNASYVDILKPTGRTDSDKYTELLTNNTRIGEVVMLIHDYCCVAGYLVGVGPNNHIKLSHEDPNNSNKSLLSIVKNSFNDPFKDGEAMINLFRRPVSTPGNRFYNASAFKRYKIIKKVARSNNNNNPE